MFRSTTMKGWTCRTILSPTTFKMPTLWKFQIFPPTNILLYLAINRLKDSKRKAVIHAHSYAFERLFISFSIYLSLESEFTVYSSLCRSIYCKKLSFKPQFDLFLKRP